MALRLTSDNLPAAYEYLRACEPFRRWKLPEADDVEFVVGADPRLHGWYVHDGMQIGISRARTGSTMKLLETMSHELCHMALAIKGHGDWTAHGAKFKRLATRVCAEHVFDLQAF